LRVRNLKKRKKKLTAKMKTEEEIKGWRRRNILKKRKKQGRKIM
jgi:hypothetical protein